MTKKIRFFSLLMLLVLMCLPASPAGANDQEAFFENLNDDLRTKPSSLFGGLTGTEFMAQMKDKHGREQTLAVFSVMSPKTELGEEKAKEIIGFLTPEMANNVISFYTLAMREALPGLDKDDDPAAKKMVALIYNDLAAKYLAGEPAAVKLCDKNYGLSAKTKMTVMMRLTTMFLENS